MQKCPNDRNICKIDLGKRKKNAFKTKNYIYSNKSLHNETNMLLC